jgi:hypothetical protein
MRTVLAKLALGATILAFVVTQLPFKASIDLPLFYMTSLSALVVALSSSCWGIVTIGTVKREKNGVLWLVLSAAIFVFWTWFWIASFHKHVG